MSESYLSGGSGKSRKPRATIISNRQINMPFIPCEQRYVTIEQLESRYRQEDKAGKILLSSKYQRDPTRHKLDTREKIIRDIMLGASIGELAFARENPTQSYNNTNGGHRAFTIFDDFIGGELAAPIYGTCKKRFSELTEEEKDTFYSRKIACVFYENLSMKEQQEHFRTMNKGVAPLTVTELINSYDDHNLISCIKKSQKSEKMHKFLFPCKKEKRIWDHKKCGLHIPYLNLLSMIIEPDTMETRLPGNSKPLEHWVLKQSSEKNYDENVEEVEDILIILSEIFNTEAPVNHTSEILFDLGRQYIISQDSTPTMSKIVFQSKAVKFINNYNKYSCGQVFPEDNLTDLEILCANYHDFLDEKGGGSVYNDERIKKRCVMIKTIFDY